jgi:hypothetical protein
VDALTTDRQFDREAVVAALQNRLESCRLSRLLSSPISYYDVRDRLPQWEMCAAAYVVSDYISH